MPAAILVDRRRPRMGRTRAVGLIGEAIQGVDDLEELADGPAGIEVVVHGVEELLAVLGDLLEQGRAAGFELAAVATGPRAGRIARRSARRTARTPGRTSAAPARSRRAGSVRNRSDGGSGCESSNAPERIRRVGVAAGRSSARSWPGRTWRSSGRPWSGGRCAASTRRTVSPV